MSKSTPSHLKQYNIFIQTRTFISRHPAITEFKKMTGQTARQRFENGYMCAESILLSTCEAIGYENPAIPAMATAFCSGTARTKGICGALQGAILATSLIHGRSDSSQCHNKCYELTQKLTEKFVDRYSSRDCFEITGCDLATKEGQLKFKENGIKCKCLGIVEDFTNYTISLLKAEKE